MIRARTATLVSDRAAVTGAMLGPITRMFDGWEVNGEAVAEYLKAR